MAKKPTLSTVASGYTSQATLNANLIALRDGFDNTLSLDGSTPNSMGADLDMDSNDILNANRINTQTLTIAGVTVSTSVEGLTSIVESRTPFAVLSAAEAATIDASVDVVVVNGYSTEGDCSPMVFKRYGASEPTFAGKFQDAGGIWFELINNEPEPQHFGVVADVILTGSVVSSGTDNASAFDDWLDHLRITKRSGFVPAGRYYTSLPLYGGGTRVRGAGSSDNLIDTNNKSLSVIHTDGGYGFIGTASSTEGTNFHQTRWTDIGFVAAGGTLSTNPITWDKTAQAYQIGAWLGRSPNYMQTITGGEVATSGGCGGYTFRNVTFQNFGYWGVYGYKLWGKSVIDDVFIRDCGISAAAALGDQYGGAINLASLSVDVRLNNVHAYGDGTGTGIKIGAVKTETDALDRLWDIGSYQVTNGCHFESFKYPMYIAATKGWYVDESNFKGNGVDYGQIGYGSNGSNDVRVIMGKNKLFNMPGLNVTHPNVTLGQLYNQDNSGCIINYWDFCRLDTIGTFSGAKGHKISLQPRGDFSAMLGGSGSRDAANSYPFMATDFLPSDYTQNRLPRFAATDGATTLVDWVEVSGTSTATKTWSCLLKNDGVDDGVIYYDITGLDGTDEDEVFTLMAWWNLSGNHFPNNFRMIVKDGGGTELFNRTLKGTTSVSNTRQYMATQVKLPSGQTTLRVQFESASTNNAYINCPILVRGTLEQMDADRWPSFWVASNDAIVCD